MRTRAAVGFLLLCVILICPCVFAQQGPAKYHGMAEVSLPGHAPVYAAMTSESFGSSSWHILFTVSEPFREYEGDGLVTVASVGEGRVLVVLGGYNASIMLTPSEPEIKTINSRGAGVARTAMTHVIVRNLPDSYVEVLMKE